MIHLWLSLALTGLDGAPVRPSADSCPRTDSTFMLTPADTLRGYHEPEPAAITLPDDAFKGPAEMRLLIDAKGRVVADSTQVLKATSRKDSVLLAKSAAKYRYRPAHVGLCPIRAWSATIKLTAVVHRSND